MTENSVAWTKVDLRVDTYNALVRAASGVGMSPTGYLNKILLEVLNGPITLDRSSLPDDTTYIDRYAAAIILDVHPQTVHRLIQSGKLRAVKRHNKHFLLRGEVLEFEKTYDNRPGRKRYQ